MSWTLTSVDRSISAQTFADLGLEGLAMSFLSLGTDRAEFRLEADWDGTAVLQHGDDVTIHDPDGVVRFSGAVRGIDRSGGEDGEWHRYTVAGPWDELEHRVFLQGWYFADNVSDASSALSLELLSHYILGQNTSGTRIAVEDAIGEVLSFAIAGGASFQAGTIDLPHVVPWDEVRDRTCAEVIRHFLRWTPDAVGWFDYTTSPPTFHCERAADLTAVNLDVSTSGVDVDGLQLIPRDDLRVPQVILNFVFENRTNGNSWRSLTQDIYPEGSDGQAYNALVRTIPLAGAEASSQRTVLEQPLETSSIADITTAAFWESAFPGLAIDEIESLTVRDGSASRSGDTGLTKYITDGAVTPWMESENGITVEEQTVTAEVGYFYRPTPTTPDGKRKRRTQWVTTTIKATDASSGTYKFTSSEGGSYTAPEAAPTGLAEVIYDALNRRHYQGSITVSDSEPDFAVGVGNLLNLTGAAAAYASMDAVVQEVRISVGAGTATHYTIGPPEHLGAADMVDFLRVTRNRPRVTNHTARIGGRAGDADTYQATGKHSPIKPGSTHGDGIETRLVVEQESPGESEDRTVVVDLDDAPDDANVPDEIEIKLRVAYVADDGEIKRVLRLASEPFALEP